MPGPVDLEGAAGVAVEDPIAVVLPFGREARVELRVNVAGSSNRDLGREDRVYAPSEPAPNDRGGGLEARDLTQGVNTLVGATRCHEANWIAGDVL